MVKFRNEINNNLLEQSKLTLKYFWAIHFFF